MPISFSLKTAMLLGGLGEEGNKHKSFANILVPCASRNLDTVGFLFKHKINLGNLKYEH